MTAYNHGTDMPASCDTLERSLLNLGSAAENLYGHKRVQLSEENPEQRVVESFWGKGKDEQFYVVFTIIIPIDGAIFSDSDSAPWTKAQEWGNLAFPEVFKG